MPGISNNEIKRLHSLSMKKFRDASGLFIVEGEKMVAEAVASPFHVESIYRTEEIGTEAMSRISQLSTPSPVLAVVKKPDSIRLDNKDVLAGIFRNGGLFLVLDSLRDPGNLGTVLRIADWFGVDGVFASADTVDIFNPKVVQSTMGAIFRVRFHYTDIERLAETVFSMGGKVYGTFLDGNDIYGEDIRTGIDGSPVLVVIGNESNGISPEMASKVSDRLYIPPYPADDPGSESLNAAVATAVTVAEFRRRSRKQL